MGKRPKLKHLTTLIGNYDEGDFKDVDLPSKFKPLKIIWIRKFLDEINFHPWIAVAQEILQDLGGQKISVVLIFLWRKPWKDLYKITFILQRVDKIMARFI